MTSDLTPAARDDVKQALAYALRFDRGKPHRMAADGMAALASEALMRHLEDAGFVVMLRPPAPPHSTSPGAAPDGTPAAPLNP